MSRKRVAIIGATGRYHCRAFNRFMRPRTASESGTATNDRCPSARGPNSCRPRRTPAPAPEPASSVASRRAACAIVDSLPGKDETTCARWWMLLAL